jgi:hypothetical protein
MLEVSKNGLFCAIYISKRSFYQDRLGTNIGKHSKKNGVFSQGVVAARDAEVKALTEKLKAFAAETRKLMDQVTKLFFFFAMPFVAEMHHFTKTGSGQT